MTSTSSLGASSSLSASHAATFFTSFRAQASALSDRIETASDPSATSALVQDLGQLRRQLLDETAQIPPRDRETHEKLLRDLSNKLATRSRQPALTTPPPPPPPGESTSESASPASTTTPQSKPARFAFKRSAPKSTASASASQSTPNAQLPGSTVPAAQPLSDQTKSVPQPESTTSSSDVHLRDETDAVLDLRTRIASDRELLTIQIRGLKNCIVIVQPLQGSIMVHDCVNCIIISEQCRQYRMHTTTDSLVVLRDCPTGATIEGCDRILFSSSAFGSPASSDQHPVLFPVQDFDHVSSLTQSPHWCWLSTKQETSSIVEQMNERASLLLSGTVPPSDLDQSRHELVTLLQARVKELFSST